MKKHYCLILALLCYMVAIAPTVSLFVTDATGQVAEIRADRELVSHSSLTAATNDQ
jgi:hypothetical protein